LRTVKKYFRKAKKINKIKQYNSFHYKNMEMYNGVGGMKNFKSLVELCC